MSELKGSNVPRDRTRVHNQQLKQTIDTAHTTSQPPLLRVSRDVNHVRHYAVVIAANI